MTYCLQLSRQMNMNCPRIYRLSRWVYNDRQFWQIFTTFIMKYGIICLNLSFLSRHILYNCLDNFFYKLSKAWYWHNSAHVQHCLCKDSCSVEFTFHVTVMVPCYGRWPLKLHSNISGLGTRLSSSHTGYLVTRSPI